ncbi:MAG: hypothetical protein E6G51_03825 [Actinobacteria bacterium]|nr:MAG: hypothetical protein E6G51_03825 [Actinomycetota bacterium]
MLIFLPLLGTAVIFPPAPVILGGFVVTLLLMLKSAAFSGPLSKKEEKKHLLKQSAAEECGLIAQWAGIAERVRGVPGFGWIPKAAYRRARREHIGVLRTVSMTMLYCACASYLFTGLALGVNDLTPTPSLSVPRFLEGLFENAAPGGGGDDDEERSYAELCKNEIPNPLDIGHQLGPLFRHDGAIKAGCGTEPFHVAESGTWASPGVCAGELRSLAVSAPGYDPAIVYGTPARFAWAAAQAGTLVALEVADPNEGDVYLVVTLEGTYAFTRPTRTLEEGESDPETCSDVGGKARPFARLEPVMVSLWLEMMERRAEWSWPEPQTDTPFGLTFTDRFDATDIAEGRCESEECWIQEGESIWSSPGSGFIAMHELTPYMPS